MDEGGDFARQFVQGADGRGQDDDAAGGGLFQRRQGDVVAAGEGAGVRARIVGIDVEVRRQMLDDQAPESAEAEQAEPEYAFAHVVIPQI